MAPWTHTYLSPQGERRLCCASREHASFIRQYIDQPGSAAEASFHPLTLDEHWNGERMRSVRRRMLAGETLPECEVCSSQMLNLHTYQRYFTESLFPHLIEAAFARTAPDGATDLRPISFDYRFTNSCNFKCRMCGSQLSSSWEQEDSEHAGWKTFSEAWTKPDVRQRMREFQDEIAEKEFAAAITEQRIEEIYWVGGEPLVWELHWKYMGMLVENGSAKKVRVRYNTNLSRIAWKGVRLFDDLLPHFKDYNVCASIDAAGKIGEFVRTGLVWGRWLENFKHGVSRKRGREDSIVMDVTLTLPGLFGMKELLDLAHELGVKMYVKVMFAFDPTKVLSPLALPRTLLNDLLDDLIAYCEPRVTWRTRVLLDTLVELRKRPTFAEEFPQGWEAGAARGKREQARVAAIRGDGKDGRLSLEEIYAARPEILKWWEAIPLDSAQDGPPAPL